MVSRKTAWGFTRWHRMHNGGIEIEGTAHAASSQANVGTTLKLTYPLNTIGERTRALKSLSSMLIMALERMDHADVDAAIAAIQLDAFGGDDPLPDSHPGQIVQTIRAARAAVDAGIAFRVEAYRMGTAHSDPEPATATAPLH